MPAKPGFDHVILTRFSVRLGHGYAISDEWLRFRWRLFCEGPAPSLAGQTNRDFTWLVFFDVASPEWLREEVAAHSPGLFTPVWLEEQWGHAPLRRAVIGVTTEPFLITTRLDSDDLLSRFFVEDVQARFDSQESLYVNFLRGIQIDGSLRLYHASFVENAFISYIERREPDAEPRTVFWCFAHEEASSYAPVLNIVGPVRWMQIVHGGNVANTVRGVRARPERVALEFDPAIPFERNVSSVRFVCDWIVSLGRLFMLWAKHPNLAVVFARGKRLQARGTTVVPQHVHRESRAVIGLRRLWRRFHR